MNCLMFLIKYRISMKCNNSLILWNSYFLKKIIRNLMKDKALIIIKINIPIHMKVYNFIKKCPIKLNKINSIKNMQINQKENYIKYQNKNENPNIFFLYQANSLYLILLHRLFQMVHLNLHNLNKIVPMYFYTARGDCTNLVMKFLCRKVLWLVYCFQPHRNINIYLLWFLLLAFISSDNILV